MKKVIFGGLSILLQLLVNNDQLKAQCENCTGGNHSGFEKLNSLPPDSSGGLAQSYILENVCGLNWAQASVEVTTRYSPTLGSGLPCTVPLVYNSCRVDSVVKAFLYFSGSYQTPYAANPASVTITNPSALVFNYLADSIGTGGDKCWGEVGSIAYRVDVTNCIDGSGNYRINLGGEGITSWAIDGMTLMVIYIDKSASYSGSIVLYDGLLTTFGGAHSQTFSGFNVCNATTSGQAFALLGDMQSNVTLTNTETYNGTTFTDSNLFYNFCNVITPLTVAQSRTTYSVYTNNGGDCYSWLMAGLYWQNTTCMTCIPSISGLTLAMNTTAAACSNNGTASVSVSGATGPLTYSWYPGGQTTDTATMLSSGTYTVYVSDGNACSSNLAFVPDNQISLGISFTLANCANPGTATVNASGGYPPYTYLWSASGQTSATATGLSAGKYYVYVTDSAGCNSRDSITMIEDSLRITVFGRTTIISGDSAYIYVVGNIPSLVTTWSWTPLSSVTYPDSSHTFVHPVVTTTYTITVSTLCGTITDTVTVFVRCANNYDEHICIATVDTLLNKNKIIWGRVNSPPATGSYNIYKDSNSSVTLIGSQSLNVLSEYIDVSSSPSAGPMGYELSTVDSCGESIKSPLHKTIYLTTASAPNAFILSWTAYVGFIPTRYRIFRGPAMNALAIIDSVPNTVLTYTDSFPPLGSIYLVEAVNPTNACVATTSIRSHSSSSSAPLSGSFSNGFNTTILGVQNIANAVSNLNIYPNPSNGQITLEWLAVSGQSSVRISIFDKLGQLLYDNSYSQIVGKNTKLLNLENLTSGIYTLRMQTSGGSTVKKVVIMHER